MLVKQERENTDKKKPQKTNSGLIADRKESGKKSHTNNFKNNESHTCLKTLIYFYFYDNFLTEKKQAKGKINPKLLIAHNRDSNTWEE